MIGLLEPSVIRYADEELPLAHLPSSIPTRALCGHRLRSGTKPIGRFDKCLDCQRLWDGGDNTR